MLLYRLTCTPDSRTTTNLWDKTSHIKQKKALKYSKPSGFKSKKTPHHQNLVGPAFQNVHHVAIWGQCLTNHRVYVLIQSLFLITMLSFNLSEPPVRLVRTWAHRDRAGLHYCVAGSGPVLPLLYLFASLFFSTLQAWYKMRAGCLVLHITPWPQFVIFHTRWSLLWNEMSFTKMKRHKSSVINLLVRPLQLSPVEDIWTADWLMPAEELKHGSLSLITYPTVSLSVGF